MKKWLNELKTLFNKDTTVSQVHSCSQSIMKIKGVEVRIKNGLIQIYTDNKPFTVVLDGEVVRRQV